MPDTAVLVLRCCYPLSLEPDCFLIGEDGIGRWEGLQQPSEMGRAGQIGSFPWGYGLWLAGGHGCILLACLSACLQHLLWHSLRAIAEVPLDGVVYSCLLPTAFFSCPFDQLAHFIAGILMRWLTFPDLSALGSPFIDDLLLKQRNEKKKKPT